MNRQPLAICLTGPTASGKTALALSLCEHLDCEIISVDSAQVYRGMDIGTAKPDAATRSRYPHHLIDIRDPAEAYSAAEFRGDAIAAMDAIVARGRTPLLVGGTMLYYRVLLQGIAALPQAEPTVRAQIRSEAERDGWPAIHARLAAVDPVSAARIRPTDTQRLQRALEVFLISGQALSRWHAEQPGHTALPCRLLQLAVAPWDRAILHRRIAERFQLMLESGFLDEVRGLYQRGDLDPAKPALRSVGYRQAWNYLAEHGSYTEMVERSIIATRQLAKRQFTWLRTWTDLHWLFMDEAGQRVTADGDSVPADARLVDAALKIINAASI